MSKFRVLESLLRELHDQITGDQDPVDATLRGFVDNIESLTHDLDSSTIPQLASKLFHANEGLVIFLDKTLRLKNIRTTKEAVIRLLADFLSANVRALRLEYFVSANDIFRKLVTSSASSSGSVKTAALTGLKTVVDASDIIPEVASKLDLETTIKKLKLELEQSDKAAYGSGLKSGLFSLLGALCKVYPHLMLELRGRLLRVFMVELKKQLKSKKPESTVIGGCFDGLDQYMFQYTVSVEEGKTEATDLFSYILMVIRENQFSRYVGLVSCLRLFSHHAIQFKSLVYQRHEELYLRLQHWCSNCGNREVKHEAFAAISTYLKVIADVLVENHPKAGPSDMAVFESLVVSFSTLLEDPSVEGKELSLAIRGYGFLARPCKLYKPGDALTFIFNQLIVKSDQFIGLEGPSHEKLMNLPSYVEALAYVIAEMDAVPAALISCIVKVSISLWRAFPNLHWKMKHVCWASLYRLIVNLSGKWHMLKLFLDGFVLEALTLSCSHDLPISDGDIRSDGYVGATHKVSFKDYLELWKHLLCFTKIRGIAVDPRLKVSLQLLIYDTFVASMLRLLSLLDVSVTESVPGNAGNMVTFLNLASVVDEIFPRYQTRSSFRWVAPLCNEFILFSMNHSDLSTSFSLLTSLMKLCKVSRYFGPKVGPPDLDDSLMEIEGGGFATSNYILERERCSVMLAKYSKEVCSSIKHIKDDLLISSLLFILALPSEIAGKTLSPVMSAVGVALRVGLTYFPLANAAIDALTEWNVLRDEFTIHLPSVLPLLDPYLSTKRENFTTKDVTMTTNSSKRGRRKIPMKFVVEIEDSVETELSKTQTKMLQLLGRLGGGLNHSVFKTVDEIIAQHAVSWDRKQHLKFSVPFQDLKPDIFLDQFLPRICQLAVSSSDRQAKVTASELLYSTTIFMIGKRAHTLSHEPGMDRLFHRLIPVLLQLACDQEQVSRQLFEPLVYQLIHWLTGSKQSKSSESALLLRAILDGIVDESDSGLRLFSCGCIAEYMTWAGKQTPPEVDNCISESSKQIIKHIYSMAVHSNPVKRLGAALAFNSVYTVYREDDSLVDSFTVEMIGNFVYSLALSHADDDSLGTVKEVTASLQHLIRIVKSKRSLLCRPNPSRRGFSGGVARGCSLPDLVDWIFKQCGRHQTDCRHIAMEILVEFVPLLPPSLSLAQWLGQWSFPQIVAVFESDDGIGGIRSNPAMDFGEFSATKTGVWLDRLLATLDCYTWSFGQRLLDVQCLGPEHGSKCWAAISSFLAKCAHPEFRDTAGSVHTPMEGTLFDSKRCTVIVRLMNFVKVLLSSPKPGVVPDGLWVGVDGFFQLLFSVVLEPKYLGFITSDIDVQLKLPEEATELVKLIRKRNSLVQPLEDALLLKLSRKEFNLRSYFPLMRLKKLDVSLGKLKDLVSGLSILLDCGFSMPVNPLEVLHQVSTFLRCHREAECGPVPPNVIAVLASLIQLAVAAGLDVAKMIEMVVKEHVDSSCLNNVVYACFSQNGGLFVDTIRGFETARVVPLLLSFLEWVSKRKKIRENKGEMIVNALLDYLPNVSSIDDAPSTFRLLQLLLLIKSDFARNAAHPGYPATLGLYCSNLEAGSSPLNTKNKFLEMLPFFLHNSEPHQSRVLDSLKALSGSCFPVTSLELHAGSPQHIDYCTCIDRLFLALSLTGNLGLFMFLLPIYCREREGVLEPEIQAYLCRFTKRLGPDLQLEVLQYLYRMVFLDTKLSADHKTNCVEKVYLSLLQQASLDILIVFFTDVVGKLVGLLEQKSPSNIVLRVFSYQLISCLYSRAPKHVVHSRDSAIVKAYHRFLGDSGKSEPLVDGLITKKVSVIACKAQELGAVPAEVERRCYCAAQNALMAVLTCTQSSPKLYALAFGQNVNLLVDQSRLYAFPIETDSPISRKMQFVAIRNSLPETSNISQNYLSSQYMADSGVSLKISEYDLNTSLSQSDMSMTKLAVDRLSVPAKPAGVGTDAGNYISLENDDLNDHECMAPFVATIRHLVRLSDKPESGKPTPKWVELLRIRLEQPSTSLNLKLFLARLVVNCQNELEMYADAFLPSMVKLAASGECGGEGITSFVVDIVGVVGLWSKSAGDVNDFKTDANDLVRFLVKHSNNSRLAILRNNIEMSKILIELWKASIRLPVAELHGLFQLVVKKRETTTREQYSNVGAQLLAVFLANGFPPFVVNELISHENYFKSILSSLFAPAEKIHSSSAEVLGMILKRDPPDLVLEARIEKCLGDLQLKHRGIFVTCLYHIYRHYPKISMKYANTLFFLLPNLAGNLKARCLLMLSSETNTELSPEIKSKNVIDLVFHHMENIKMAALQFFKMAVKKLEGKDLETLLGKLKNLDKFDSPASRQLVYDIMEYVYDSSAEHEASRAVAKSVLLKGLLDEDEALRTKILYLWGHQSRLSVAIRERLLSICKDYYSADSETAFLAAATNLMLEMSSRSPDYEQPMWESPLSKCSFRSTRIDHSWRNVSKGTMPAFASTLLSQTQLTDGDSIGGQNPRVKATQNVNLFTPTQDVNKTFNWLTQSSMDTYSDTVSVRLDESSTLMISSRPAVRPPRQSQYKSKASLKDSVVASDSSEYIVDPEKSSLALNLKRRFIKDRTSRQASYFIQRELRKQATREKLKHDRKERREKSVTLYRDYRIGELPDVQIPFRSIIAPLQALAQYDPYISRMLFAKLAGGILRSGVFGDEMRSSVENMLSGSEKYWPPFVAALIDLSFELSDSYVLDAGLVSNACQFSNQESLGIALLEQYLYIQAVEDRRPVKRPRESLNVSTKTKIWIELGRLYKSIGCFDSVRFIFSKHVTSNEVTKNAFVAESNGDYVDAAKLYNKALLNDTITSAEEDLLDDCRMNCYNQLCEWTKLDECATINLENRDLNGVWSDIYFQEHYLPYIMRSRLKRSLRSGTDQAFVSFIDNSMANDERKAFLENKYPAEICALFMDKGDLDQSSYYLNLAINGLLMSWSSVDQLMIGKKRSLLQSVQPLMELGEFCDLLRRPSSESGELADVLAKSSNNFPHYVFDSVHAWSDVIENRLVFLRKFASANHVPASDALVRRFKGNNILEMSIAAIKQRNYHLANRLLIEGEPAPGDNLELRMHYAHSIVELNHKTCRSTPAYSHKAVNTLVKCLLKLEDCGSESDLSLKHRDLEAETYNLLASAVINLDSGVLTQFEYGEIAKRVGGLLDTHNIPVALYEKSYSCITASVAYHEKVDDTAELGSVYAYLGLFCDSLLRASDSSENVGLEQLSFVSELPSVVVKSILKAMRFGSTKAMNMFPRLLQLINDNSACRLEFKSLSSEVPTWMFIQWLPQVMSVVDKNEGDTVFGILEHMVRQYPQALAYPWMISCESFIFHHGNTPNKEFVERVTSLLNENPLIRMFVSALECVMWPDLFIADWIKTTSLQLQKESTRRSDKDEEELAKLYNELRSSLFFAACADNGSGDNAASQSLHGTIRRIFSDEYTDTFLKLLGDTPQNFKKMGLSDFERVKRELMNLKTKFLPKFRGALDLSHYSHWLASFNSIDFKYELEVPGQYKGGSRPGHNHVLISSFDGKVTSMASIRRPLRINIRGSDAKEYPFLVKCGEDLRQDQRIEQLFDLMNRILVGDSVCGKQGMHLTTYTVIPMTQRLGLIQWVDDCQPLKEFIFDENGQGNLYNTVKGRYLELFDTYFGIAKQDKSFVKLFGGNVRNTPANIYGAQLIFCNETQTRRHYTKVVAQLESDLMRKSFLNLSASIEGFHSLQRNFVVSYSVMCICQYLVGIGDRHLANSMVQLSSGSVLGIDFGHAFGSATQFLPVPELLPFRLTPQIVNVMRPIGVKGLFRSTMCHCLSALKLHKEALLNVMDVFIKEPLLDWKQKSAKKQKHEGVLLDVDIFPQQKVDVVRMKLNGGNPAAVMAKEYREGHSRSPFCSTYLSLIRGVDGHKLRSSQAAADLSVEDQVDCLIDLATDQNILGRSYVGWSPYS